MSPDEFMFGEQEKGMGEACDGVKALDFVLLGAFFGLFRGV